MIIRLIKAREVRRTEHVTRMEKKRDGYSVLMEEPEERTSLLKLRNRWQDYKNICLQGMGRGVDWFNLTQVRWPAGWLL